MKPDLRLVPTVANAHLQALRSLDTRARLYEGQLPSSYAPESFGLQDDYSAFDLIVWAVALSAALVTGYSLAGLFIQWVRG